MSKIAILGCGWLGFPLAHQLVQSGFLVNGSTTSPAKIPVLSASGIAAFLLELQMQAPLGDWEGFLAEVELLVVAVPPQLRKSTSENWVDKMQLLLERVRQSNCKKVLLISSTSVYPDHNQVAVESDELGATSQLVAGENLFLQADFCQTTVVRFGGLIGEDRHPVRFLAGRTQLENPVAPINLIHQADCLAILKKIIAAPFQKQVYNAVAPHHPTRVEYYTQKAREFQLPLPEFDYSKPSVGKTVSSEKLQKTLGYTFIHPEL